MRIPRRPRPISPQLRESVAKKHARFMQMFGDNDWKKIDKKIQEYGNDYYRTELFEDRPTMVRALGDFDTFRTGTPSMNVVADDMRQFYELIPLTPAVKKEVIEVPTPAPKAKAQEFKNEKVKEIIKENPELIEVQTTQLMEDDLQQAMREAQVKEQIDNIGKNVGNQLIDKALLVAGGLGLGGIITASMMNKPEVSQEELEQLRMLQEAGLL